MVIGDPMYKGFPRVGKDQLEWTANKLLKGAGVGADPTEIDVPSVPSAISGLATNRPQTDSLIEGGLFYAIDTMQTWKNVAGSWQLQEPSSPWSFANATLSDFQANAATGSTFVWEPWKINDNDTALYARAQQPDSYAEINFGKWVKIDQWRIFGHADNNENGVWKIQYYGTDLAWHDWKIGIPTNKAVWTSMASETEVTCSRVKIIATTKDTGSKDSVLGELEVYHS